MNFNLSPTYILAVHPDPYIWGSASGFGIHGGISIWRVPDVLAAKPSYQTRSVI